MRIAASLCVLVLLTIAAPAQGQVNTHVLLEAVDPLGSPIDEVPLGSEFELRVIVDDVRTSTPEKGLGGEDLFGVFSAYVRTTSSPDLVSFVPGTLDIAFRYLDVRSDTSSPGEIRAGGVWIDLAPPTQSPGNDPQLLWSATMRADAVGDVRFASFFDDFPEDAPDQAEWLLYGDFNIQLAENVQFSDLQVTIVPEPAAIVPFAVGLVVLGAVARRKAGRKAERKAKG